MAYAEKKAMYASTWCYGLLEWRISRENPQGNPQRPNGWSDGPSFGTVYSPIKYRETEGIKDITGDSYTASKTQQIDKQQWEDYGNAQGADQVIKRLTATGTSQRLPANPTRVLSVRYTAPEDIPAGTVIAVPTPANLYDCTTWDYFYAVDDVEYDYMGYFASAHSNQTETKTVLAQSGSTALQNFAFDMEE